MIEPAGIDKQEIVDHPLSQEPQHGVTLRSVIIGFAAIVPGVFWGVYGDVVSQTDMMATSLMIPPIIILAVLILINAGLRKIRPRWALSRSELLTIYAMVTVGVIMSGIGMIQFITTTMGAVPHFATPENGWNTYLGYVPHYIMPRLNAIDGFYKGNEPVPWSAWKMPIVFWSVFLFAMMFSMFCINTIARRQWMDKERLPFPIVQLPLEMTDPKSGFFANKVMWAGFAIAAGLETMNALNYLYPAVPYIQLRAFNLQPFFTTPPWDSIGYFPTTFYPLAIGLGFILSTDVNFSLWFFYLMTKLENVAVAALGLRGAGGTLSAPPYLGPQAVGAFVGIVLVTIYLSKSHIKDVILTAFKREGGIDDSAEPLAYSTAVIGLIGGFVAMVVCCVLVGVSPLVAAVYLGIYLVFATTISRLRAEAGPAWTMGPDMNALDCIVQPFGSSIFSKQNLVALAYFNWFSIELRGCPMPMQIEAMKMTSAAKMRQRSLSLLLLLAIVVGIAVGFWACLAVWYKSGAGTAKVGPWRPNMGRAPFERVTGYIKNPTRPDLAGMGATVFGACVVFALSFLRTKFVGFPFHPAGYVLGTTGTMYWLWCPFMIAWVCKVIITKYAGIKGYRAAMPFFLGLVFGDYVVSGILALIGSIFGIQMYRCFPC